MKLSWPHHARLDWSALRPALVCAVAVGAIQALAAAVAHRLAGAGAQASEALVWLDLGRAGATALVAGWLIAWALRRKPPAFSTSSEPSVAGSSDDLESALANARWFIRMRWLACVAAELGLVLETSGGGLLPAESGPRLQICVVTLFVFNAVCWLILHRVKNLTRFLFAQASVDLLILTAMLHFSGGIENPLYAIYLFHIVLAAALLPSNLAFGITFLASMLLLTLGLTEGFGWIDRYPISLGYHRALLRVGATTLAPVGMLTRLGSALMLFWVTSYFVVALRDRTRDHEARLIRAAGVERDLNRQLGLVVDSIGAALSLWTSPTHISWCNHLAAESDLCADPTHASCEPTCLARTLVHRVFLNGVDAEEERFVGHAEGRSSQFHGRAVPLRAEAGHVEMVLLIVRDVTSHRAMELEVLHTTKMAALGRVAAGMAHEIGNPLAAMNVRLALMRQDPSPEFTRESALLLQQHVERIHRLVNTVRRFGRPSGVEPRALDVTDVVHDVLRMLQHDPRARGIELRTDLAEDLPVVRAVRDKLTQVLVNLCLNGLESMTAGGVLQLRTRVDDGAIRIEVTDAGSGLPEQAKANLFRPFFTTKEDGSGLGLFLSNQIICEMGGTIEATDAPGQGTCFTVRIPVDAAAEGSTGAGKEATA